MGKMLNEDKTKARMLCNDLSLERYNEAYDIVSSLAEDHGTFDKPTILEKMIEIGRLSNEAQQLQDIKKIIV